MRKAIVPARRRIVVSVFALIVCLWATAKIAAPSRPQDTSESAGSESVVKEVFMVPTRDGVLLKTILFHLASAKPPGPVVLLRTPCDQERHAAPARRFAAAGYYAVTQDSDEHFGSGGSFSFLRRGTG